MHLTTDTLLISKAAGFLCVISDARDLERGRSWQCPRLRWKGKSTCEHRGHQALMSLMWPERALGTQSTMLKAPSDPRQSSSLVSLVLVSL